MYGVVRMGKVNGKMNTEVPPSEGTSEFKCLNHLFDLP